MTVVTTAEQQLTEGERQAERDLGTITNELEHLASDVAEHTTTIEGLRGDRQWITQRLEALERDLVAIPKVPEELAESLRTAIADLSTRLDRLEATTHSEEHTEPPHHRERDEERESDEEGRRDDETHKGHNLLDRVF